MPTTAQQKRRIADLYYSDARGRRGLSDTDVISELMTIILMNPSAAQVTLIQNFLQARKADSQVVEDAVPAQATAKIATLNADQAELDTLTGAIP